VIKQIWKIVASLILVFTFSSQLTISAASQTEIAANLQPLVQIEAKNSVELSQNWLARFNYYRRAAGLPLVTEAPVYSVDLAKHVNYMLLNVPVEGLWHGETSGRPGYTAEGAQAAAESNLFWFSSGAPYGTSAMSIDAWMGSIHHRYGMLNPDLTTTGFSLGCDNQNCGTGLNVTRGIVWDSNPRPSGVFYPGSDQKGVNTDIILTWQFHSEPTAVLKNAAIVDSSGQPIPVTSTSPLYGDYFNMVSVTPNTSLSNGMTYTADVTIQVGDRQLSQTWSFTTIIFGDVPPDYWSGDFIDRLYTTGVTGGCSTHQLSFCPESSVTRAQMAVFLEKSLRYPNNFAPPNVSPTFDDTVGHWAEDWIEALRGDGVTGGCGPNLYCPDSPVTRAQMAVFLLKSKYGSGYTPPAVGANTGFSDVSVTYWAAAWIKQLAAEGITGGCGGDDFCPESHVTRAQMAVFLVRAFDLP
jgi:hypothetical protein